MLLPNIKFLKHGRHFKHLVLKYSKVWALEPSTFNTSCTLWSSWNLQHDEWHVHWLHVNCSKTSCWMSSCKLHTLIFQVLFETCILHVLRILVHSQINLNIRQTCSAISSDIQQWLVLVIKVKKWKDKSSWFVLSNAQSNWHEGYSSMVEVFTYSCSYTKKEGWHPHW